MKTNTLGKASAIFAHHHFDTFPVNGPMANGGMKCARLLLAAFCGAVRLMLSRHNNTIHVCLMDIFSVSPPYQKTITIADTNQNHSREALTQDGSQKEPVRIYQQHQIILARAH